MVKKTAGIIFYFGAEFRVFFYMVYFLNIFNELYLMQTKYKLLKRVLSKSGMIFGAGVDIKNAL